MYDIPLKVTVGIPTHMPPRRGRFSTTPPHGHTTSFRHEVGFMEAVDRARALIDPTLTRNSFIHHATLRMAQAINKHHDAYLQWVRETIANEHGKPE